MASELGAEAALLSIQGRRLGDAEIVSAWGQWRRLEALAHPDRARAAGRFRDDGRPIARRLDPRLQGGFESGSPDRGVQGGDQPIADALVAPVRSPSGRSGALAVGFAAKLEDGRDLALDALASYAALVGLWLDDTGALLRLVRAAYRDALTGCLSYAALMHELEREIKRAERTCQPLACLFVDIDSFKEVNDIAGHQTGNRVLVEWATKLMARARQTDTVGRYGGDEFVVVLPDTGPDGAEALADSLRLEIVHATGELLGAPLSVSIGISTWTSGMDADELIESADAAMRAERARRRVAR
ncbi:MAG: diguanylate cyclase domain-containing protein [Solirubrobacterales bacterium]